MTTTAKFPLLGRTETKDLTISQGHTLWNQQAVFTGANPHIVIVGLVDSTVFTGSYDNSFHNFQPWGIESIYLMKDGKQYHSIG